MMSPHMGYAMPASIICPRCGRKYSIEYYEREKFCKECETLLKVSAGGESATWKDLFPYEAYPQQVKFMEDVESTVAQGDVLIAEACNGFGKTISTLSCLLPKRKQLIYATRTHEQVRQVLLELESINSKADKSFRAVNLASRSFLCINDECRELPGGEAAEHCQILRKNGDCPFKHEFEKTPKKLPVILGRKQLVDEGKKRKLCPYFLSRMMSQEADIVVAPYPYVFNPIIRLITNLNLKGKILILDEGHNIDQVGQEILSDTLTERNLSAAAEEIKLVGKSPRYINRLGNHLLKTDNPKPRPINPRTLESKLEKVLKVDINTFIEGHSQLIESIKAKKIQSGNPPISYLNGVLNFFELIQTSQKKKYIGLYTRNYFGAPTIEYRCLDPSLAIKPLVDQADGVLIMSGTLTPIDTFSEIIGQEKAVQKTYDPIQKSDKIKMIIETGVTSAYKERTTQMINKIGTLLTQDLKQVDNGALVFFTQRGFMNQCIKNWRKSNKITTRKGLTYMGDKRFFREGRNAQQNRDIVNTYKLSTSTLGGATLFCVFRGRNSEGSNFPEKQARGIFLIGVPYANYGNPYVKAQIKYFNKEKRGLGNKWYKMDAFRSANQSIGRGIRGVTDWCHYYLYDRRYHQHRNLISKWAQGKAPEKRKTRGKKQSSFKKLSEDTIIEI